MNVTAIPTSPAENRLTHAPEGLQKVAEATLLLLVAVVGVSGNTLVVIAVALSRKLQTTGHIYVATLAVIDFLTALVQVVHAVVVVSGVESVVLWGACAFVAALNLNLLGYSMSVLMLIAINRVQVITNNKPTSRESSSWWKIVGSIVALFVFDTVCITVTAIVDGARFELNKGFCQHRGKYLELVTGLAMFILLTITVICYIRLYVHVKRHFRKVSHVRTERSFAQCEQTRAPSTAVTAVNVIAMDSHAGCSPSDRQKDSDQCTLGVLHGNHSVSNSKSDGESPAEERNRKKRMSKDTQVTLNMFLLVVSFVACIIPAMCFQIIPGDNNAGWISFLILISNCCWNPLIYSWKHPDFKPIFRCILFGKFSQIQEPTAWLRNKLRKA